MSGAGYFEAGHVNDTITGETTGTKTSDFIDISKLVVIGGQGALTAQYESEGGDGGVAGKGGIVKASSNTKVYAFNGNSYTDGTLYNDGENETKIYAQDGKLLEIYKYSIGWNIIDYRSADFFKELLGKQVNSQIDSYVTLIHNGESKTKNYCVRDEMKCSLSGYKNPANSSNYGIGSGAGYIELDNGTYKVESSLN